MTPVVPKGTMTAPVGMAVQLYSVRDLPGSLPDILRRVRGFGFEGVEFADRFPEADPEALAAALEETGLEVLGVHADLEAIEGSLAGENDLLDRCRTAGVGRLIVPHIASRHVQTGSATRALSDRLASLARDLDAHGIELGYHTAEQEFRPFLPEAIPRLLGAAPLPSGATTYASKGLARVRQDWAGGLLGPGGFDTLVERVPPENFTFELDIPKVVAAGADPVQVISAVGDRVSLVHLGDIARTGWLSHTEVPPGEGAVDLEAVVEAAVEADVEWVVYENELDLDPAAKLDDGRSLYERLLDSPAVTVE